MHGPLAPTAGGREQRLRWQPLPFDGVRLTGGLWRERKAANRRAGIPHGLRMLEQAGSVDNLRLAAGAPTSADVYQGMLFSDSDVYKWLEAVAWEAGEDPADELLGPAEEAIGLIEAAQRPDGYLNSYYQVTGGERYRDLAHGHELYCAGHLIQAAVAFARTVGDRRLLGVAERFADHLCVKFLDRGDEGVPGHPEIETALVELHRLTGSDRYLRLAALLLDRRGYGWLGPGRFGSAYFQDHVPVREATAVVGHAVRALYLLAGVVDAYVEGGDRALLDAALRQWADLTGGKLYLTGGAGSRHRDESFGEPYELPPDRAYCETCAAIASVQWNWRLLLATGDGRHADLIERTLLNGFLSGVSRDATRFRYVNSLQVRGGDERLPWYPCACCPPNVMRLLASVGHYLASASADGLQLHQYASMRLDSGGPDGFAAEVDTGYPADGRVRLTVRRAPARPLRLALRVPGWADGHRLRVDGVDVRDGALQSGYAVVERRWSAGQRLELDLPMPPRFTWPDPRIDAVRGCVAVERGPLVYCVEAADLPDDLPLSSAVVDVDARLEDRPVADGAVAVGLRLAAVDTSAWTGGLYRTGRPAAAAGPFRDALAVPYHGWGHRGAGAMRVWLPVAGR